MTVGITGRSLDLVELERVASAGEAVELAAGVLERVEAGREVVLRALARDEPVYGLTTGVGVRKRTRVADEELAGFNRRLILEHRVGQGPAAPEPAVRAQLLLLANGFARGTSGVRPELLERVARRPQPRAAPNVRLLGSSGRPTCPRTRTWRTGWSRESSSRRRRASRSLQQHVLDGAGRSGVRRRRAPAGRGRRRGRLDLEAFGANVMLLHPEVAEQRPYPGLREALDRLRGLLDGSYLWEAGTARNLQDPLTFARCRRSTARRATRSLRRAASSPSS